MLRAIYVLCVWFLAGKCRMSAAADSSEVKALNGVWIPTEAELAGQPMPEAVLKSITLKIENGQYEVTVGREPDAGTVALVSSAHPKAMKITGVKGPNAGKVFPAIYELKADTLRVCYDLSGAQTPTEFKTSPGTQLYLVTYRRQAAFSSTAAQFVELTADIQTVRWISPYAGKPPSVQVKNWTARCVVGTNSWLIEEDFDGMTRDAWWYTGSNVIAHTVVLKYPSERPDLFQRNHPEIVVGRGYTKTWETRHGESVPSRVLTIGEPGGTEKINLPWLAFCSAPFLKTEGRRIPAPSLGEATLYTIYSDTTTTFSDDLGLPICMELYSTNQPLCHYRTVGSTNVLGWSFPLEFHTTQYRMNYRTGVWEVHMTASGKLKTIGVGREPCVPTERQKEDEK